MNRIEVFLDAAALIALIHTKDKYHIRAQHILRELSTSHTFLVTTQIVLIEAANLLKRWKLHHLALAVIDSVIVAQSAGSLTLLPVDNALLLRACELLKDRPDKEWSLTDCLSFVVMQDRGIDRAFTADRHFEQAGFERLLKDE